MNHPIPSAATAHPGDTMPGPRPGDDRSLGDLFGELTTEATTLVRQEIALAKTEIKNDAKALGTNAGLAIGGGLVAYAGFVVLLVALGLGLNSALDSPWLGLLIVAVATLVVGGLVVGKGLAALKTVDPTPERTLKTLQEDKEWLTNQTP